MFLYRDLKNKELMRMMFLESKCFCFPLLGVVKNCVFLGWLCDMFSLFHRSLHTGLQWAASKAYLLYIQIVSGIPRSKLGSTWSSLKAKPPAGFRYLSPNLDILIPPFHNPNCCNKTEYMQAFFHRHRPVPSNCRDICVYQRLLNISIIDLWEILWTVGCNQ